MLAALPTLDTSGWITEPSEKASRLMAYFFASEFSQSNLFLGHVQSLPNLLAMNAFNYDNLRAEIETEMSKLFTGYFDGNDISVEVKPVNSNGVDSESKFSVVIDVRLSAEGIYLSLGRELIINKAKIERIINLNGEQA